MKPFNRIFQILVIAALGWTTLSFTACSGTNEYDGPIVDLRYDVEDEYERDHTNPEAIIIRVRSLHTPWEVTGSADWYTITPSRGEAGETVTVTIAMTNNTSLDDREDTISIKSDYWTGKQFHIFQHGTAFLEAEDMELVQDGADYDLPVLSNQKWSAKVTEGDAWLTIKSGATGESNGVVKFSTVTNKGERRPGQITLYDRYDRPTVLVSITQNGVVLTPIYPEDPDPNEETVSWIRLYHEAQTLEIPVESNSVWKVEKGDPNFEDWFELEQTDFQNDGTIRVVMSENTSTAVRTGTLVVSSVSSEAGVEPVVRNIKFKQGNQRIAEVKGQNIRVNSAQTLGNAPAGRYDFTVVGANGTDMRINIYYPNKRWTDGNPREIRYWTNRANGTDDGIPMVSTYPWVGNQFNLDASVGYSKNANPGTYAVFDKSVEHVLSLEISKANLPGYDELCAYVTWYIDGEMLALGNGSNSAKMPSKPDGTILASTNWDMTYAEMDDPDAYIQAFGSFTVVKWEYTAPIDWGSAE